MQVGTFERYHVHITHAFFIVSSASSLGHGGHKEEWDGAVEEEGAVQ